MSRSSYARTRTRPPRFLAASGFSPTGPRILAIGAGAFLLVSYLSVFFYVVDVVGGVRWFAVAVGGALLLATAFARWASVRRGLLLGGLLFVAGVGTYVLLVPSLHAELFTVEFVRRWLSYLSGISVLEFERVDLWAIAVAPGPAFLSWLLLLSRRYDASAFVGGLMLGFFALTGDADATTTLVGMTSLLATLGLGAVEREAGTFRELLRLGFVLALAVVVARSIQVVPAGGGGGSGSGGSGGSGDGQALSGDLENADERAHVHESISLSPTVLFTIGANEVVEWRVAAYDRYTGEDWIRTGGTAAYEGPLDAPPGETIDVEQAVRIERAVGTLPAAWKPIEVEGLEPAALRVTDHGGLTPARSIEPGETYAVRSAVPDVTVEALREADDSYPEAILERHLQLPESTPERVRELAAEVAGDAAEPYEAAILLRRWLSSQKTYALAVDRPAGDLVDAFLFGMERGYCVYYASAMVVMLRTLGIPARFVLGYTSGQHLGENRWVVRGLDSHAWVEVYFPGHGWVGFDPTPGVARRDARIDVLERARRDGVEGVDTEESADVSATAIDTDVESVESNVTVRANETDPTNVSGLPTDPRTANASTLPDDGGPGTGLEDPAGGLDTALRSALAGRDRVAILSGAVGVTIGLHWIGAFERASRAVTLRWQRPTDSPRADVVRAFERFELLLARRYRARSTGETPRQYVAATVGRSDVGRAQSLLDLYERASYGDGVTRSEADEAIGIVDGFVAADG